MAPSAEEEDVRAMLALLEGVDGRTHHLRFPDIERTGDATPGAVESKELGAELAALTPQTRARYGIDDETSGVLVLDVQKPDPSGLLPGDVIKQVGQESVTGPHDLEKAIARAKDDGSRAVLLLVTRQGADLFVGVKLGVA